MKKLEQFLRRLRAEYLIFSFVSVFVLARSVNHIEPYPAGDAIEYILTTEALCNHFSPDIRLEDSKSFKQAFLKKDKWEKNYKYEFFDQTEAFLDIKNPPFMSQSNGIFTSKNNKKFSYHFFLYSFINVPARSLVNIFDANPMICFQVTNAFLIILSGFFIIFYAGLSKWKNILFFLIFVFSSNYWYLGWPHPEVFSICLVTLSFLSYFREKYYLSLILISIATLQNQPIAVMAIFIGLKVLVTYGFNKKNIIRMGMIYTMVLIPSLYYYLNFGTINIIKDLGFLDASKINFTRVFGFFFDVNQGVVLVIPFILLIYVVIVIYKWIKVLFRKEKFQFELLLPIFIVGMALISCTMVNWNHGQAIVNRYATWFSAIIIVHCVFLVSNWRYLFSIIVLNYFFMTQLVTVFYHEQFNIRDGSQNTHRPLAKWLIETHPEWYNPDPTIFIIRTTRIGDMTEKASPVFYIKDYSNVQKIAVHRNMVSGLEEYGFSKEEITRLIPKLKFINDWAYINKGEFKTSLSGTDIYLKIKVKKLLSIEADIRRSNGWMKQIEEKAKIWNKTIDEVVRIDAEYIFNEQEKEK